MITSEAVSVRTALRLPPLKSEDQRNVEFLQPQIIYKDSNNLLAFEQ